MSWIVWTIFFVMGLSAFDAVTSSFWIRDRLTLSAAQLVEIAIYTQLPWSIKILFGSIIDLISNRKRVILLGSALQFIGYALFSLWQYQYFQLSEYSALLITGLITTIGIVLCQATAQTLAVEVVDNTPSAQGRMQVFNRIAFSSGALLAAFATGYLAKSFPAEQVFAARMILPIIVTIMALYGHYNGHSRSENGIRNLLIAISFGLFCLLVRDQLAIFLAQMVVINYLLYRIGKNSPGFVLACAAIFLFRLSPSYGPGYTWWLTSPNGLGFDEQFMGHLRLISVVADLVVLGLLAKVMAKGNIFASLLGLTVAGIFLSLPDFIAYYKVLPWVDNRHLMLVDTALVAPLADLSMIPLGIIIALNAPEKERGMYMSLTASFMNMALLGGDLMTKYLNQFFTVTREDFSQLGQLMTYSFGIGTVLSVLGLVILKRSRV